MKYFKYILTTLVILLILVFLIGIIKYNVDLNRYIAQEGYDRSKDIKDSIVQMTEVYIVGTVHFETDKIRRNDVYNYLDKISPSIILFESDSKGLNKILKRTDYFSQFNRAFKGQKEIEKAVTLKYKKRNPECTILPYEWEKRDWYRFKHRLGNKSGELLNSAIRLKNENLLSDSQSLDISKFLELNTELIKIGEYGSVYDLNNSTTDSIVKQRQAYVYNDIPEMMKKRKDFFENQKFIPIHMQYWNIRNKAMTQNILNEIKQNSKEKIAVLNGFYHRYYLIDELKKYETEFNFTIKEL